MVLASRNAAIAAYHDWIRQRPELLAVVLVLKGKRLGCWRPPLPCPTMATGWPILADVWLGLDRVSADRGPSQHR
jgi:hypothetical protein